MRLDLATRSRVVHLKAEGFTYKQIQKRLEDEGIRVSVKSLYQLVTKHRATMSVLDRTRGRAPKILQGEHYKFIDQALTDNDELTTRQLRTLLTEKFPTLTLSLSTVKRARRDLGWVVTSPKYCQLIRHANKEKRLAWCTKMIEDQEQFENVIFSDECSVMLETHRKKCYRRRGDPRKLKPRPKHPVKVHVWGGISMRGATRVVIFSGIMTAIRYTEILESSLVPFIRDVFAASPHRLQQDNDPKHCARYTQNYFSTKGIEWWKTTPESPDLNSIENVWGSMKEYLRNHYKPKGLEDLKTGIKQFWRTLTPAVCTRYIRHLHTVMPVVVEKEGGPSGY